MIESEQMKKKEEEKKDIYQSIQIKFVFFFFGFLKNILLDIQDPHSQWKSNEATNDILRKFRNYEI